MTPSFNLAYGLFLNSLERPNKLALEGSGKEFTYTELTRLVRNVAAALKFAGIKPGDRIGILGSRSPEACVGVLGAGWAGAVYVPISLKAPEERIRTILELSRPSALVADAAGVSLLTPEILEKCPNLVFVPEDHSLQQTTLRTEQKIQPISGLSDTDELKQPESVQGEDLAYIMFTSGTTGIPKGVMISLNSVHHFLTVMQAHYGFVAEDRVAEPIELSFDLSVFNMFMTWNAGASLHLVPSAQAMAPAKFIREKRITIWFSTPSVITMMKKTKLLKPRSLPDLRYSIFCGEPLPVSSALSWREAAPASIIDNLYGPTEATVACLQQRLTDPPVVTSQRAIIAIGEPIQGMEACIMGPDQRVLSFEEPGELALSGPQLATGYYGKPELTATRFPIHSGKRWYLTGDVAYQDSAGRFHHLGRTDNQIKVLGYRVELEEIEAHLRQVTGSDLVAAVAWPISNGIAERIVGFVAQQEMDPNKIREGLRKKIPSYMVPAFIRVIDQMPFNPSGKIDRIALIEMLKSETE